MKNLLLLIVPACVYLAVIPLREAWGSYYYAINSDPSYLYLFNGLNIAQCRPSAHVDNPGSTVQVISALTIRATAFLRKTKNIEQDVILNPELYIVAINRVMFAFCLVTLFLFGVLAYRYNNNLLMSMMMQCAPFVSWQTMRIFLKVSPEMFIFISCLFWAITLLRLSFKNDLQENHLRYTFWFALLTGFSLATKLTMVPLIIIPMILLPFRIFINYLLLSLIFFMLMIFPAWKHFEYLLRWVNSLFHHSSLYGSGASNIIQFPDAFISVGKLLMLEHTFYLALVIAFVMLLLVTGKISTAGFRQSLDTKILCALLAAAGMQLLMVAKHYNPHYLIPSLTLFTTIIFFTVKVYSDSRHTLNFFSRIKTPTVKISMIVLLVIMLFVRHSLKIKELSILPAIGNTIIYDGGWLILLLLLVQPIIIRLIRPEIRNWNLHHLLNSNIVLLAFIYCIRHADLPGFRERLVAEANDSQQIMNTLNNRFNDYTLIFGERSSSILYALKYGANENFPQAHYFEKMKTLYNQEPYFWDHSASFKTWTEITSLSKILEINDKVILECDNRFTPRSDLEKLALTENVSLEKVYSGKSAELYIIRQNERP